MSKYSGTITVFDEDPNIVKERDLTQDEIIEFILEEAPEEEEVEEPKKNKKTKARKTVTCKTCGETGHTKKTCPEKSGEQTAAKKKQRSGRRPCEDCGSIGSRHFNTCNKVPKASEAFPDENIPYVEPVPEVAPVVKPSKPLSGEEFSNLVEAMQDKEFMSGKYALTNGVSPREVNKAVPIIHKDGTYQDYIDDLS